MSHDAPSRGRFITLEGPEGAGKSTQGVLLCRHLERSGRTARLVREPGGTPLGEQIRTIVLARDARHAAEADALLFNAARAQLVRDVIEPALGAGEDVVCDRFSDSTLAYQGYGALLDLEQLTRIAEFATRAVRPDLTILLDLPVAVGLRRRAAGMAEGWTRFEAAEEHPGDFHERVRDGFLALAAREPGRWRVVDAAADPDHVASEIAALVEPLLGRGEPTSDAVRIS